MSWELYIPPAVKQKRTSVRITQEQRQFIIDHINDRPRRKIIEQAQVSLATFYQIVKENGGQIDHSLSTRNRDLEKFIIENFSRMSTTEIMQHTGALRSRINRIAKEHHLKHDADVEKRLRDENRRHLDEIRKKCDHRKCGESLKRIMKIEELRVMSGLKQKTSLHLRRMPTKYYKAAWHLMHCYNYIWSLDDPYNVYYDDETQRVKTEDLYRRKYKLNILPAV